MAKEKVQSAVITDESQIKNALETIRTEFRAGGGCNTIGGSVIGGQHNETLNKTALSKAREVIMNADPAILARAQGKVKRVNQPTSADFAWMI